MNLFTKKAQTESNTGSYNTNSFRGTKVKKPDEKSTRILESLNPKPMLIFDQKVEQSDVKKVQPKLLTSKLPSAFNINLRSKKRYILIN